MRQRTIEIVEAELADVKSRMRELWQELHELRMDKAGVHVGDVVRTKKGEARVTSVDTQWTGQPWIKGVLRRKDGSWGSREQHFFSHWEAA